ncbi:hypothetical protein P872_06050 [Rhodonellum psychrophilum GCM71 = DSM 17998]|uniref:Uncharacterized protein n=2 Tax=Rhodonellum TaxID=336827 RepID=U5BYV8_9BACT|nr:MULTISPECIES: hypothetical protein [Rhodonellum]ERM83033.1 hypothetical protein P872_06050 [Rhodonellum psychrophilum GCM71 = DSM 17998]SDZ47597.1 hypothetical protein SAMN05444412_11661 [Rhodonellum ikkaensis]
MKNLTPLFVLAFTLLLFSCGEDADEPTLVEKDVRIEIDFEGSADKYLITFGIHTLNRGINGFVTPIITQPANLQWTQIIPQANGYNLTSDGSIGNLIVTSDQPAHTVGFIFNATYKGGIPDTNFQVLKASIRLFGNNTEVKRYNFQARPIGEVSVPISEVVRF